MNTLLLEEAGDGLYILKLNRPAQLNALNTQMLDELELVLDELEPVLDEPEVPDKPDLPHRGHEGRNLRGLIITGEGPKAFAAGADISEMSTMTPEQAREFSLKGNRIFRRIKMLPVPVIAAVNGYALGGGCELAMSCDIILCSSRAVFGQPETGLGICPGFGGTIRLQKRIGMQAAKELIYSGRLIKADEAVSLGLALRQCAQDELLEEAKKMMRTFLKNSSSAISASKKSVNRTADLPAGEAVSAEAECFSECYLHADQRERMEQFLMSGKKGKEKK